MLAREAIAERSTDRVLASQGVSANRQGGTAGIERPPEVTQGGAAFRAWDLISHEVTLSGAATISGNIPDNCYPPGTIAGCIN